MNNKGITRNLLRGARTAAITIICMMLCAAPATAQEDNDGMSWREWLEAYNDLLEGLSQEDGTLGEFLADNSNINQRLLRYLFGDNWPELLDVPINELIDFEALQTDMDNIEDVSDFLEQLNDYMNENYPELDFDISNEEIEAFLEMMEAFLNEYYPELDIDLENMEDLAGILDLIGTTLEELGDALAEFLGGLGDDEEGEGEHTPEGESDVEGEPAGEGEGEHTSEGESDVEGEPAGEGEGEHTPEGESDMEGEPDDNGDDTNGGCIACRNAADGKQILGDWLLIALSIMSVTALSKVTKRT